MGLKKITNKKETNKKGQHDKDLEEFLKELEGEEGISALVKNHDYSWYQQTFKEEHPTNVKLNITNTTTTTAAATKTLTTFIPPTISNSTSKEELLFWSVFRNIYLKSIIFNNIKSSYRLGVYSYDEIFNAEWCIKNGHHGLLYHKVIKGEYLNFNCTTKMKRGNERKKHDPNDFFKYSVFNIFKEDQIFISKLFNNYPNNYFKPSHSNNTISNYLNNLAIEYDNLALIQVLFQDFKFIPTNYSLKKAIDYGSTNYVNYLIKTFEFPEIKKDVNWKTVLEPITNDDNNHHLFNIRMDIMFNILKKEPPKAFDNGSLLNFQIYEQPLKLILESCYSIVNIVPYLSTYINNFKNGEGNIINRLNKFADKLFIDQLISEPFKILSIHKLNEIKSTFNQDQLIQTIGQFSCNDKRIKKLFNMLIMFTTLDNKRKNMLYNYSFYKSKYFSRLIIPSVSSSSNIKDEIKSYHFGNFNLKEVIVEPGENNCFKLHNSGVDIIFKYCPLVDKDKRISFLQKAIKNLNLEQRKDIRYSSYLNIIEYFINEDDLELLDLVIKEFSDKDGVITPCSFNFFSPNFYKKFKSFPMFEKVYKLYPIQNRSNAYRSNTIQHQLFDLIDYCIKNKPEIARYIKSNYPEEYSNALLNNKSYRLRFEDNNTLNGAKFILENWSDFNHYEPSDIKYLISKIWENVKIKTIEDWIWFSNNKPKDANGQIILLNTFNLKSLDISCGRFINFEKECGYFKIDNSFIILSFYYSLKKDELSTQETQLKLQLFLDKYGHKAVLNILLDELIKRNDILILNTILSRVTLDCSESYIIDYLFKDSIQLGNIQIFKILIQSEYRKIFKDNLGEYDVSRLFNDSIYFGHIEILDLIVKEFNLSKDYQPKFTSLNSCKVANANNFYLIDYVNNNFPKIELNIIINS